MAAEIGSEHAEARASRSSASLRKRRPWRVDAVEADDGRCGRVAPLVQRAAARARENQTRTALRVSACPLARCSCVEDDRRPPRASRLRSRRSRATASLAPAPGEEALDAAPGRSARCRARLGAARESTASRSRERLAPGVPVIIRDGRSGAAPTRACKAARTSNVQVLPKPLAPELLEHALSSAPSARRPLRHPREPARRSRQVLADAEASASTAGFSAATTACPSPWPLETLERLDGAAERDVDPRQRRALDARAAERPARDRRRSTTSIVRRHPGGRDRAALPAADAGRARRGPLRPRLAALGRRELPAAAGRRRRASARRRARPNRRLRPQPPAVPPAGAERHVPRQSRQRGHAARRRPARSLGDAGTATSRSAASSTTSSARRMRSGRWAASSATSPPTGSCAAPTSRAPRRASARRSPAAPSRPDSSPSPARRLAERVLVDLRGRRRAPSPRTIVIPLAAVERRDDVRLELRRRRARAGEAAGERHREAARQRRGDQLLRARAGRRVLRARAATSPSVGR